jgi:hypothetical protein
MFNVISAWNCEQTAKEVPAMPICHPATHNHPKRNRLVLHIAE